VRTKGYRERDALRSHRLCRNGYQSQSRREPPETYAPPSSCSLINLHGIFFFF